MLLPGVAGQAGGKGLDDDPMQDGADGGALAVGIPRFPCVTFSV
jgi:hypothetical protein